MKDLCTAPLTRSRVQTGIEPPTRSAARNQRGSFFAAGIGSPVLPVDH
jgi:hypothetical protein